MSTSIKNGFISFWVQNWDWKENHFNWSFFIDLPRGIQKSKIIGRLFAPTSKYTKWVFHFRWATTESFLAVRQKVSHLQKLRNKLKSQRYWHTVPRKLVGCTSPRELKAMSYFFILSVDRIIANLIEWQFG